MIRLAAWTPSDVVSLVVSIVAILSGAAVTIWSQSRNERVAREARQDERSAANKAREVAERREWLERLAPLLQDARAIASDVSAHGWDLSGMSQNARNQFGKEVQERWIRVKDGLGEAIIAHPSPEVREAIEACRSAFTAVLSVWAQAQQTDVDNSASGQRMVEQQERLARATRHLTDLLHGSS